MTEFEAAVEQVRRLVVRPQIGVQTLQLAQVKKGILSEPARDGSSGAQEEIAEGGKSHAAHTLDLTAWQFGMAEMTIGEGFLCKDAGTSGLALVDGQYAGATRGGSSVRSNPKPLSWS